MKNKFLLKMMILSLFFTMKVGYLNAQKVAKIGTEEYATLHAAVNAVANGETITLVNNVEEDVTIVQKEDVKFTIDGAGKTFKGTITVDGKSKRYATAGVTIKDVNFNVTEGCSYDACIRLGDGTSATRYTNNVTLQDCTFTDNDYSIVAVKSYTGGDKNLQIINCTATKMHSLAQLANVEEGLVISGCNVECARGIALGRSQEATISDCTIKANDDKYGIRIDAETVGRNIEIDNCDITAFIPVVVRKADTDSNITFTGTNTMTAKNTDGLWCAIGTSEYEKNGEMPTVATGKVTVTVSDENLTMAGVYGEYAPAAKIGETEYETLADAIAAADNQTVTILNDIAISEMLTIPAGKTVTLDLNGKTVSMHDNSSATSALIKNNGILTIKDSAQNGKFSFNTSTPSANNAYASNTISNYGTITVLSGIIENTTVGGACYALDNYAGSLATIAGGKLQAEKTALRIFNWTNGEEAKATLNINGGEIISEDGYGVNLNLGNKPFVALNINGGIITTNDTDYNLAVYVVNKNSAENITINVEDGTLNGSFALNGLTSTTMVEGTVSISGGIIESVICYDTPAYGFIVGGTFLVRPSDEMIAEGYAIVENANGTYGVGEQSLAGEGTKANPYIINNVADLEFFRTSVNAGETTYNAANVWVALGEEDIDLNNEQWISIGSESKPYIGNFDGNGKTIKNLKVIETEAIEGKAYVGFFGYAKNVTIQNVTFENVNLNIACLDIDHSQGHIGAVTGSIEGTSTIQDVTVKGDVIVEATFDANGASRVAVVAGGNAYGNVTMKNVHVIANEGSYLKANNNTGALAGQLQGKAAFTDCTSNINVTVKKFFAGGLIGIAAGDNTFTNCHTTGNVTVTAGREGRANDQYRVGGIAGGWADGPKKVCTLTNCTYTGTVSGTNADGSVAYPLDYAGYVGRGYTLTNCAGSKVVIDGKEYVQASNSTYGIYIVDGVYEIGTAAALKWFATEVNSGNNYFAGETVKLINDIDLNNVEWTPIGSAYKDHGFMGNFDGNGKTIKNLQITNITPDSDGYVYAGLFGVTEGAENNQNTIKNLTIENVTITTTGHIVSAAIAYPYYTIVDNVKVCGDIAITGGDYTAGVLAYTRRCVNASNLSIVGNTTTTTTTTNNNNNNNNSFVKGNKIVGGVISDIQTNGGLIADYKNFSAEGVTVTGAKSVGGISGIISGQTLNGASVKNVTLNAQEGTNQIGIVSGSWGDVSTITDVVVENVAGATGIIGASYDTGIPVQARIGDTYYATIAEAMAEATAEEVISIVNNIELTETLTIPAAAGKTVTLDLNGKTITGTPTEATAYQVIQNLGTLTITDNTEAKDGAVVCNHTLSGSTSYAVNTIVNSGSLTIEAGTIENKSTASGQIGYAIDNNSTSYNSVLTIKGGKLTVSGSNYYDGIRQFCNSTTADNSVIIEGGEVSSLWMQNPSDAPSQNTKDVKGSFVITGGKLNALYLEPSTAFTGSISGGHVGSISRFQAAEGRDIENFITGGTFSTDVTAYCAEGFVCVANGDGTYSVEEQSLEGEGTEASPYLIRDLEDLVFFRDQVNSGENYFDGQYIELADHIDMAGVNWVGIGSITKDHGFMGNFDGNGYTIKNLTITNPTIDSDGYAYAGLFSITEGIDKDNQNTIKNLTIENVTITTTGHIVSAAIAYPYYTKVDNVKVCGNIKIEGGHYTSGVLAYTRRCVDASNLKVEGTEGSYIKGQMTVGGVISDIQMNGGLTANYSNFSVSGLEVSVEVGGERNVGGIAGIISGQTLNGATVKNVKLSCDNNCVGIVAGSLDLASTITNVEFENVEGATAIIGASWKTGDPVQARIGDTYYTTIAKAFSAAKSGDEVVILNDIVLPSVTDNGAFEIAATVGAVTLNLNGHDITSSERIGYSGRTNYAFDNYANLTIKGEGTITARGIQNYGTLTIAGDEVTIISNDENYGGGACIYGYEGSATLIQGGTFRGLAKGAGAVNTQGSLEITGGTFSAEGKQDDGFHVYTILFKGAGTENSISGAVVSGGKHGVIGAIGCETLTIEGGEFTRAGVHGQSGHVLYVANAELIVNGGTFVNEDSSAGSTVLCTVEGGKAYVTGGSFTNDGNANVILNRGEIELTGGTFSTDVTAYCAEGYSALPSLQNTFVVGVTPTATVNNLGATVVPAEGYTCYGGGSNNEDMPLSFVMQFLADQTEEAMETSPFADWYGDFVITFSGIENDKFTADGCYLAGHYGSFGWVKVPVDGMEIENDARYPVMLGVGYGIQYKYICSSVEDFRCAMYIPEEILEANPNLQVKLELSVVDNSQGADAAAEALVKNENIYEVSSFNYYADDFNMSVVARIDNVTYKTLSEAIEAVQNGQTITMIADAEMATNVTISADKTFTLELNGKTIVYNSTTQGEAMITNKGNFTINDEVGTGVIKYNYTGPADSSYGKGNYTISNAGKLTVNGGKITIADLSGHAKYPIDNNSTAGNAELVINGGHLYNYNTSAIRQFCNSTTNTNSVTINGGLIEGYCAIWVQNPGKNTVNGQLTITGGEIKSTAKAYVDGTSALDQVSSAIYFTIAGEGGSWDENSSIAITGGTINENVYLDEQAPASVTLMKEATFNGYVSFKLSEGTELKHNGLEKNVTIEKDIIGTDVETGAEQNYGWSAISAPTTTGNVTFNGISSVHDFYEYVESKELEWQYITVDNDAATLTPGRGYLYANEENTTLTFNGNLNASAVKLELSYSEKDLAGFHMVGNPFTYNINNGNFTTEDNTRLAVGFYVMNGQGGFEAKEGTTTIAPMEAVLIKTEAETILSINPKAQVTRDAKSNNGQLAINVSNAQYSDVAYVSFNEGLGLDKINHRNNEIPMVYVPVEGTNYAIAMMNKEVTEIPVSFKAATMGTYTIGVEAQDCEFSTMTLVDRLTGIETNLLMEDYTFMATTNDNAARFIIRLSENANTNSSDSFVFINNDELVFNNVDGNAIVKIYDMLGRPVAEYNVYESARISTSAFQGGAYIIQMLDENNVKVQKIIID